MEECWNLQSKDYCNMTTSSHHNHIPILQSHSHIPIHIPSFLRSIHCIRHNSYDIWKEETIVRTGSSSTTVQLRGILSSPSSLEPNTNENSRVARHNDSDVWTTISSAAHSVCLVLEWKSSSTWFETTKLFAWVLGSEEALFIQTRLH